MAFSAMVTNSARVTERDRSMDPVRSPTMMPKAFTVWTAWSSGAAALAAPTGRIKERDNTPARAREESRFFMGSAPF